MPTSPSLVAVLVVRDESTVLAACLASLRGVVDAVHVHDTGSADGTVAVARAAGAVVTRGAWTDDFAAARNAALAPVTAPWVLSLDADERLLADATVLRTLLATTSYDGLTVEIDNVHDELPFTHRAPRLFRPSAAHWVGRVHEQLHGADGPTVLGTAARDAVRLDHLGYSSAGARAQKSARNAALAQRDLDQLVGGGAHPQQVARTLLDLGRSMVGAGRAQDAVDTFETLRELFPGTPEALQGTDALARLLLAAGMDEVTLALVDQLRSGGAPPAYCDWLAAQALAQLGDVDRAWTLLSGVHEVVDTAGRRYDPAHLRELTGLVSQLRAVSSGVAR